jgi:threonylcarbamoyladenosine tRNA methylthiotransferase MtaB
MHWDKHTFSIRTLGCKVNQYESQLIREQFLNNGFTEIDGKQPADVYIINTCTVTHHADRESRRLIRHANHANPKARIVATGCYVEKDADIINRIEGVTTIIKNCDKEKLFSLTVHRTPLTVNRTISDFAGHTKAFVKIQDGCNNRCSFCKVPLVRGRSRSRPLDDIKKEVVGLVEKGFQEIVLSGICLGAWGHDIGGLEPVDLLEELVVLNGKFRIRLSSIELRYISDQLLGMIATSPKMCRHLHIPLQSGDNTILQRMNRPYTKEEFLAFVRKVTSVMPEIGITTDVLVGFPGEDDIHFDNTVSVIQQCRPHRVHIFSYSRREGTTAAELQETATPDAVKKRVTRLQRVVDTLSYEYRRMFLGKTVEVLVESHSAPSEQHAQGYTDTYVRMLLNDYSGCKGNLVRCKVTDVSPHHTIGESL